MSKDELKAKFVAKIKEVGKKAVENIIKLKDVRATRQSINDFFAALQTNGKLFVSVVIAACVVMVFTAFVIFFVNIKGPEEVMVPEVRGKELTQALIEMQNKELYPKITLRYSEVPGDEGTILDQSPSAGSIVKGYSRVSLVVSRGVVVDHVEDFVGMDFNELKMKLQTLFAGSAKPLIVLDNPEYIADVSAAGTILAQDPAEGTEIAEPITLHLVVSRGPNFENTRVPALVGKSLEEMLSYAEKAKIVFDYTSRLPQKGEEPGTVVSQEETEEEFIRNYSRFKVELALPRGEVKEKVYGIFSADLSDYPYPVPMRVDAETPDGETFTVASVLHSGGSFTLPYAVPKETVLTLYIVEKAAKKVTVR